MSERSASLMRPPPPTCVDLPVSSSMCARSMPTVVPSARSMRPSTLTGTVVLRHLVVLRHVRIEVVLPVEHARLDGAAERHAEAHRQLDRLLVEHRQRPGQTEAHRTYVGVRLRAELVATTAEDLRLGSELAVHLEPDHHLPTGLHSTASL